VRRRSPTTTSRFDRRPHLTAGSCVPTSTTGRDRWDQTVRVTRDQTHCDGGGTRRGPVCVLLRLGGAQGQRRRAWRGHGQRWRERHVGGLGFPAGKTACTVSFGGKQGQNVTIVSEQKIQVTTPAADPGPVDVMVTFDDGRAFRLAGGFAFKVPDQAKAR